MRLAEAFKALRKSRSLSLRSMARLIGVEFNTLARFERGQDISSKTWTKLMVWLLKD